MKKLIFAIAISLGTVSFAQTETAKTSGPPAGNAIKGDFYGATVSDKSVKKAITGKKLEKQLESEMTLKNVAIKGKVVDVCDKKGCWLTVETNSTQSFMVKMKDYAFFVPLALRGKEVILEGDAELQMTSVEDLKHYAEDAKKSKEEIAMITEPKKEISFMASGIRVLN